MVSRLRRPARVTFCTFYSYFFYIFSTSWCPAQLPHVDDNRCDRGHRFRWRSGEKRTFAFRRTLLTTKFLHKSCNFRISCSSPHAASFTRVAAGRLSTARRSRARARPRWSEVWGTRAVRRILLTAIFSIFCRKIAISSVRRTVRDHLDNSRQKRTDTAYLTTTIVLQLYSD